MATAEMEKLEGEGGGKRDGVADSGGELAYCGATQFDMIGRKMEGLISDCCLRMWQVNLL
jgi:hypothetical protein